MPVATLVGVTLTEGDHTRVVEANPYFPPGSLDKDLFEACDTSYPNVEDECSIIEDATRYYPKPMDAAKNTKAHVAFYGNKVEVASQCRPIALAES